MWSAHNERGSYRCSSESMIVAVTASTLPRPRDPCRVASGAKRRWQVRSPRFLPGVFMTARSGAAHDRLMTDTIDLRPGDPAVPSHGPVAHGVAVDVLAVTRHAGGRQLLHEVSFSVAPGELVALVGGSGAGKTTLLETMAGLRPPSSRGVLYDGATLAHGAGARSGFAPQADIIPRALPLRRTLRYAAGLRLPAGTDAAGIAQTVDET